MPHGGTAWVPARKIVEQAVLCVDEGSLQGVKQTSHHSRIKYDYSKAVIRSGKFPKGEAVGVESYVEYTYMIRPAAFVAWARGKGYAVAPELNAMFPLAKVKVSRGPHKGAKTNQVNAAKRREALRAAIGFILQTTPRQQGLSATRWNAEMVFTILKKQHQAGNLKEYFSQKVTLLTDKKTVLPIIQEQLDTKIR
ncbi:MAG: hypothetical protein SGI88_02095 [Candidatus Hydrogenedentes bacterium]|nr:hypothetical protein [Candidatus Hydrogenedentota bacterium]